MTSDLTSVREDYLAHLAVERGVSDHTLAAYGRDLARYGNYLTSLGKTSIGDVSSDDLASYVETLRTGSDGRTPLSAASTARAVVVVRGWHRFALQEGITETDPAHEVRPPAAVKRLPKAITVDEVERLLDAASAGEGPLPLRDRALLEVLYSTGARITEAVSLAVDDVDLSAAIPMVRLFGKGRRERIVPVGRPAVEAIQAYLVRARPLLASSGKGGPALFLGQRGQAFSRQSAWAVLQQAAARAALTTHVSPHTLRHSYATHLLAGGADVRVVQELLGHASVTTTQLYTQVTVQTMREVYAASHPRALG